MTRVSPSNRGFLYNKKNPAYLKPGSGCLPFEGTSEVGMVPTLRPA